MQAGTTRRNVLLGATGLALAHATNGAAQGLALPAAPVALNVIDVAGNLQLTQAGDRAVPGSRTRTSSPGSPSRARPRRSCRRS